MSATVETDEIQSVRFLPEGLGFFCPRISPSTVQETAAKNQGFAGMRATHSKAQGEMRQQSVGSALSSADPMQVTARIVSLIDTVRYIKLATKAGPYIRFVGGFLGIVWCLRLRCIV
jgi:hypothetical protein